MTRLSNTIGPGWRDLPGALSGERILTHNLVVGGGTITAGVLGVAFQSLASHQLRPGDYGSVFAVVTLITFIGLPATAFSLLMAQETSRGRASGHQAASATLLRRGNRALMLVGVALACLIALGSSVSARFLNVPVELLLAASVGIPFGLALPLLLGEFQGEQRFVAFSLLMIGQAGAKLICAIVLGLVFGPFGVIAGVSLATIAVYLVALRLLRRKLAIRPNLPWWRPAARYLAVVLPSTLSLAVLLSADVIIVKHFFQAHPAGEYAAVAAVGRAIFWGATAVATVLFPKVVFRTTQGRSGLPLVSASLVLIAFGGIMGLTLFWATSGWLLTAFAGGAYRGGAVYLPWYALGMAMLGGVAVLVATYQSRGRPGFLAVLLPLTILEPVLLLTFHDSLIQVVQVVDVAMGVILVSLGALYVAQSRALLDAPVVPDDGPAADLAKVGINP